MVLLGWHKRAQGTGARVRQQQIFLESHHKDCRRKQLAKVRLMFLRAAFGAFVRNYIRKQRKALRRIPVWDSHGSGTSAGSHGARRHSQGSSNGRLRRTSTGTYEDPAVVYVREKHLSNGHKNGHLKEEIPPDLELIKVVDQPTEVRQPLDNPPKRNC